MIWRKVSKMEGNDLEKGFKDARNDLKERSGLLKGVEGERFVEIV